MKYTLFACTLLIAAGCFLSCQHSPVSPVDDGFANFVPMGKVIPAAHPAWTFYTSAYPKGKLTYYVSISDTDGTHPANVFTCAFGVHPWFPSWSPAGSSISFLENTGSGTWGEYALKTVDVAVTNGVVIASNPRAIVSYTAANQKRIIGQAWCPAASGTTGYGKIAYMVITPTQAQIYLVDAASLVVTGPVYSVNLTANQLNGSTLAWSHDGNHLAFAQYSGINVAAADDIATVKILDLTNGTTLTLLDDPTAPMSIIAGLKWSDNVSPLNAKDILAFAMSRKGVPSSTDWVLCTYDLSNGTLKEITTNGWAPFWSPNNSELVYGGMTGGSYKYDMLTGSITSLGLPWGDWK
jgi:Tol biopolymer transport system component